MIEWREVARDDTGLNLYRIDAEMGHPVSPGQGRFPTLQPPCSPSSLWASCAQALQLGAVRTHPPVTVTRNG